MCQMCQMCQMAKSEKKSKCAVSWSTARFFPMNTLDTLDTKSIFESGFNLNPP